MYEEFLTFENGSKSHIYLRVFLQAINGEMG